jgi:phage terminase large subunit-like protein
VEGQPTSRHFALLCFDDMIERRNVTNPEQIAKATEAWEMSDNLGVAEGSRKWYIGTRYLMGDTYEVMIQRKLVKARIYPATHNGLETGRPVFLTEQRWAEIKVQQRGTLAAQMLQNPAAGKQAVFSVRWFKPWEIRPATLNVYIMADPSRGRTTRSDRTAILVIGIDANSNKYLLDGVRHRMKLSDRWHWLKTLQWKWSQMPGVQICAVGYERYGQQSDDEYFQEQMRKLPAEQQFAIQELAWPREGSNSKKDRVQRLQPDVEIGKLLFPAVIKHPELGEVIWQPPPENDDKMVMAQLRGLTRPMRAVHAVGQAYRAATAITRKDEDGNIYDLTWELIQEMIVFPFGSHDDAVDTASRIYDMEAVPPIAIEMLGAPLIHAFDA